MKKISAESELDFSTDVPATQLKRELSIRGLSAWEGYKCCVRGRNIATRFIDEVGDMIQGIWMKTTGKGRASDPRTFKQESLVFPVKGPEVAPFPKRYVGDLPRIALPILIVAALVIETFDGDAWVEDSNMPIPHDAYETSLLVSACRAIATSLRKKTESDCYRCIRRKVWGQRKLRRTVTILSSTKLKSRQSTRSIGDRKLNLRTPHR